MYYQYYCHYDNYHYYNHETHYYKKITWQNIFHYHQDYQHYNYHYLIIINFIINILLLIFIHSILQFNFKKYSLTFNYVFIF